MFRLAVIALLSSLAFSLSSPLSPLSPRSIIDPTAVGTMAVSPDFTVYIGDGTQLLPVLLDSAHPCTFLVRSNISSPHKPPITVNPNASSFPLSLNINTSTCQYIPTANQGSISVSGVTAFGYIGFAGWVSPISNILIADQATSLDFLGGASGVLSMFGTSILNCKTSLITQNFWSNERLSDGTFFYLAPRRSNINGPGLISWGTTPNMTVLGTENYNITNIVARSNLTNDTTAQAESCAFAIPTTLAVHTNGVGTSFASSGNYILATMSKFVIVEKPFATNVMSGFQPSGTMASDWVRVKCDAIPPSTFVRIGGVDLEINPVDAIVMQGGVCYSAFQSAKPGEVLKLGQPFLKNVGMKVNWDGSIEFTARPYYTA